MANFHNLGNHNHKEIGDRRTLEISHCIGDLLQTANMEITGNISSSVQHSKDEVMPSHSCLLANRFPI